MYYKNGQVYGSIQAIRNELKDVSLPHLVSDAQLAELGYDKVVDNGQPTVTAVQTVQDGGVLLVDGVPTKVWNVVDMFQDIPEVLDSDGVTVISPAVTKLEQETAYVAKLESDARKAMVPAVVTMRQARLALLEVGLLAAVDNAIATGADDVLKIEWEYATEVRRDWGRLITMATSLSLTSIDLDNLFILAGSK